VSIGGPSVRLPQQSGEEPQRGAQVERADSTHNQRTINILRAAHNAGSEFGIQSPADHGDTARLELFIDADRALMGVVSEIIALKADTECSMITFPQCAVGAPWRKDTTCMCTPALGFILSELELLKCAHESHEQRAGGVRESDGTWNSKRAAAYPAQLNLILAQAMARLAAPMHTNVLTFRYLIILQLEDDCRYLNGQDVRHDGGQFLA